MYLSSREWVTGFTSIIFQVWSRLGIFCMYYGTDTDYFFYNLGRSPYDGFPCVSRCDSGVWLLPWSWDPRERASARQSLWHPVHSDLQLWPGLHAEWRRAPGLWAEPPVEPRAAQLWR